MKKNSKDKKAQAKKQPKDHKIAAKPAKKRSPVKSPIVKDSKIKDHEKEYVYLDRLITDKASKKEKKPKEPIAPTEHKEIPEPVKTDDKHTEMPAAEAPKEDIEAKPAMPAPETIILEPADDSKNRIEALLFACGKYMDEQTISELCSIDKRKVRKSLDELRKDYESRNSALTIFQEDTSWKINVREKYVSLVRKIVSDTELGKSVMETLAVIAWKSPIFQSDVVKIRGNKCYDHIEDLENAGFVAKDKKGRSYILKTTDKFYNYFDIDKGNLKSVFEAVKVPVPAAQQTTLDDVDRQVPQSPDMSSKIESINIMKKTESEDEKNLQREFLSSIDAKLMQVSEKNTILEQEMPRPTHDPGNIQPPIINGQENSVEIRDPEIIHPSDNQDSPQVETDPSNQLLLGDTQDRSADNPNQQASKPKTLTKKQLEKKFKDELLRVRDKMDSKEKKDA
jgi:segregation and condensation protein B